MAARRAQKSNPERPIARWRPSTYGQGGIEIFQSDLNAAFAAAGFNITATPSDATRIEEVIDCFRIHAQFHSGPSQVDLRKNFQRLVAKLDRVLEWTFEGSAPVASLPFHPTFNEKWSFATTIAENVSPDRHAQPSRNGATSAKA